MSTLVFFFFFFGRAGGGGGGGGGGCGLLGDVCVGLLYVWDSLCFMFYGVLGYFYFFYSSMSIPKLSHMCLV